MSTAETVDLGVQGTCDPAFTAVREALERNFTNHGEIGSAVCVYHQGKKVVDLWGGHQDAARTVPWREDTMCIFYSIAKSLCALSVHILADRGLVDLEAPVAKYWPEFAQNGKESVLVRHIISHYCGVCFNDAADPGDIFNYDKMIRVLEAQELAWPPGTKGAYNTVNIGYLAGEVVRRVTGTPIRDFVRENICEPLGADYKIGVDEADLDRVADLSPNPAGFSMGGKAGPDSPLMRACTAMPKPMDTALQNSAKFRTAGIPSFGGFGTARAMARIYAALANGGEIDGTRLLSAEALARATTDQWEDEADGTTGQPMRMTMGFWKNTAGRTPMGPNPEAFGHSGSGGARALADPERNLALAYVTNLQSEGLGTGVRTEAVVDAAFANL
jgi:CubicO group peptidase (beta-lactamase class C family)